MPPSNPRQAFRSFHEPIETALGCITAGRRLIPNTQDLIPGRVNSIVLNRGDPVPLNTERDIHISVSDVIKIIRDDRPENGPF